jgi:hypothetical protein
MRSSEWGRQPLTVVAPFGFFILAGTLALFIAFVVLVITPRSSLSVRSNYCGPNYHLLRRYGNPI